MFLLLPPTVEDSLHPGQISASPSRKVDLTVFRWWLHNRTPRQSLIHSGKLFLLYGLIYFLLFCCSIWFPCESMYTPLTLSSTTKEFSLGPYLTEVLSWAGWPAP